MNRYELVIIVNPSLDKKQVTSIDINMQNKINAYGKVTNKEDKGIKKLAYEIEKNKEGHYFVYEFEISDNKKQKAIAEIERFCRIKDEIMKFLTLKL